MLTLKTINPSYLYNFGEVEDVNLTKEGLCLINGVNHDDPGSHNDVGKSNLIKSITRLLYDEDRSSTTINSIPNKVLNKGCASCITFDIGESSYRVILTRSWRTKKLPFNPGNSEIINAGDLYKGSDIYLEVLENDVWRDIRDASLSKTKAKLQNVLSLSFEQFEASSYMAQNSNFLALSGRPGDKFNLVEPFLDFSVWDDVQNKLNSLFQDFNLKIQEIENKIKIAEATFSNLESSETLYKDYEDVCKELKELQDKEVVDKEENRKRINEVENKKKALYEKLYEQKSYTFYFSFENELKALSMELEDINLVKEKEISKAKQSKNSTSGVISFLETDLAVSNAEIKRLESEIRKTNSLGAECNTCGQPINNKEETLRSLQEALDDQMAVKMTISQRLQQFKEDVESTYQKKIKEIKVKSQEREDFVKSEVESLLKEKEEEEKKFHSAKNLSILKLNQDIQRLDEEKKELQNQEVQDSIRAAKIESTEQRMRDIVSRRMRVAEKIQKYQDEISNLQIDLEKIKADRSQYDLLEKHLGAKGIRNFETMSILTEMSDYASEYLAKLSGGMVNISISPYKETNDSSALFSGVSKITEIVKDSFKEGVPATLSGGAVYRQMSIAIMFALRSIAYARGFGTNVLFLDEVDRDMSELNTDRLVSFFSEFRKSCPSIFLISHNERLKNTLHPDKELLVVRKDGISRIVT